MECSITRNRYSVHFSTVIRSPPINPYISTCRFISSGGKDSGQDYRAHGAVDHTTAGEHQRLDQFCPSDGEVGSNAVNLERKASKVFRPKAADFAEVSRRSSPLE